VHLFLKHVYKTYYQTHPKTWLYFLEKMASKHHINKIEQEALRHFLLIELARAYPLSRFTDLDTRIHLAYKAVHGDEGHRSVFLESAKHFEIDDPRVLADLVFKSALLGNLESLDIMQFLPQEQKILNQLFYLLHEKYPHKLSTELRKVKTVDPHAGMLAEVYLKTL
jgi:hypothetical protein